MAEEESPVIGNETAAETTAPAAPGTDDAFMAELQRAGISTPQELKGKLDAGAQAGRIAQLLGNTRAEAENLKREVAELRALAGKKPREDIDYNEGQPVDLKKVISETLREERRREQLEAQQAQQVVYQTWNRITTDQDFHLVQPIWEQALRNPQLVGQIQSGQVNPVDLYNNMVRDYYKGIVRQSYDTIIKLRGGQPKPKVPHMETGSNIPQTPEEMSDNRQKVNQFRERVNKGGQLSETEELAAIEAIIGNI